MNRFSKGLFALALAASSVLAACGGGSHSVVPSAGKSADHKASFVKVTVHVPAPRKQSARTVAYEKSQLGSHRSAATRKPDFLDAATTELDFTLETNNGTPVSSGDQAAFDFTIYLQDSSECTPDGNGGYNCTVTYPAPVGTDTYNVSAYACSVSGSSSTQSCQSLGGTLSLLSASYTSVNVQYNQTTVVAFTLSPVVASLDWAPVTYATQAGYGAMPNTLWLTQPNGSNIPKYTPGSPGSYTCTYTAGLSKTMNGCYEPVAKGYAIAYGEVLEVRDPTGAIIIGASNNGTVYQTPVYLDNSGNAVTINWHCTDNAGGTSLTWETGGGPYTSNASATPANNAFNSPVANPAADPDGGNTTDGNGNPVKAVGNNGAEMNWDGADQPVLDKPDSCSATTSNGLSTTLDFYAGLGEGGVTLPSASPSASASPSPSPSATPTAAPTGTPLPALSCTFNEYPLPTASSQPLGITSGPDNALWFAEMKFANPSKVGRMTASGSVTEYTVPSTFSTPSEITTGPDGALWFTENTAQQIGRITTSGTITEYPVYATGMPDDIVTGPDGALWFTWDPNGTGGVTQIGRMTTSGSYTLYPLPNPQSLANNITVGPDGALWFTEQSGNNIGRITTSGTITEYPIPTASSSPSGITAGPDGALWFTEFGADKIGRITTSGTITEYAVPTAFAEVDQIVSGPQGALWFTELNPNYTDKIGRISTSGQIDECPVPTHASYPEGLTVGPDGNLWFSETGGNKIGVLMP